MSTPSSGEPLTWIAEPGAGGVLAGVGDALLDDPVDRPADHVGHAVVGLHEVVVLDGEPGLLGLGDQPRQVGVRRLRPVERLAGVHVAQHAEHAAQVGERLVGRRLDDRGARPHLLGGEVLAEGERSGVHGDLGDPVGEHVVHLPRDPGPLVGAGLRDPELLLGLGALGAVPQRPHQLAPGADVHAPAEDPGGEDRVDGERQPLRLVVLHRLDRG